MLGTFQRGMQLLPCSTALEMAACQSWKCLILLHKADFLWHFQLWQDAVSKPVELGRSCIPLWKVQSIGNWNHK